MVDGLGGKYDLFGGSNVDECFGGLADVENE